MLTVNGNNRQKYVIVCLPAEFLVHVFRRSAILNLVAGTLLLYKVGEHRLDQDVKLPWLWSFQHGFIYQPDETLGYC